MMVPAKYILFAFASVFALLAVLDKRKSGRLSPGRKTQLCVATIFLIIAACLHFFVKSSNL